MTSGFFIFAGGIPETPTTSQQFLGLSEVSRFCCCVLRWMLADTCCQGLSAGDREWVLTAVIVLFRPAVKSECAKCEFEICTASISTERKRKKMLFCGLCQGGTDNSYGSQFKVFFLAVNKIGKGFTIL